MFKKVENLNKVCTKTWNRNKIPPVSTQELIREYTKYDYSLINQSLRAGEDIGNYEELSDFLSESNLYNNVIVFRGVYGNDFIQKFLIFHKEGTFFEDKAFISSSLAYDIANCHSKRQTDINTKYIVFSINVPNDKNAYLIKDYSYFPEELEVLIKNDTLFEVKKITETSHIYDIALEVV